MSQSCLRVRVPTSSLYRGNQIAPHKFYLYSVMRRIRDHVLQPITL